MLDETNKEETVRREFINMLVEFTKYITKGLMKTTILERIQKATHSNMIFRLTLSFPCASPKLTRYGPDLNKLTKIVEDGGYVLDLEDQICMGKYDGNNKLYVKKFPYLDNENVLLLLHQTCLEFSTCRRHVAATIISVYCNLIRDCEDFMIGQRFGIIDGDPSCIEYLHKVNGILKSKLKHNYDYATVLEVRRFSRRKKIKNEK